MPTAVIYARFSCSKQREASIDDQLRVCREYAAREGWEVVGEYSDYAMSGKTDARPRFQEMIARAGESDFVLVYMLDRFSRDPFDAPYYKRELTKRGVQLVSATESIPDSPEGIIYEKLLEGLAACESAKTSARVRRGMEGNALKCLYNGERVFGYSVEPETRRFAIDPEEAALVREAFARRAAGEAANSIAADFRARGVRSPRGGACSAHFVSNMLKNERYRGVYRWGDVRVEGGMPRILTDEEFQAVQRAPRPRRSVGEWRDYPLAGKAMCGSCGASMQGHSAHGRHGGRYDYYRCGAGCGSKPIRADVLEDALASAVRELMGDRSEAMRVAREVERYRTGGDIGARRSQIIGARRRAEDDLANLMAAIKAGLAHPSMQAEIDAAQEALGRAKRDLAMLEAESAFDADDFADFLQWGATLDAATVLDAFVGQVLVFDGYAVATLNYDGESKEPARLRVEAERVRMESRWWTVGALPRTPSALVVAGVACVVLPRAA